MPSRTQGWLTTYIETRDMTLTGDVLRQVDICFVVDTTGSMGPFIKEAKLKLIETVSQLSSNSSIQLQVALVEYRDHPPQEKSFVTRVYALTPDLAKAQKSIEKLSASGGGDYPEAVYDGVAAACRELDWREHSLRFAVLVGDAPPHGYLARPSHDSFADGCPCGLDEQAVAAMAERERITFHALCMSRDEVTLQAFTDVAKGTGGVCHRVANSAKVVDLISEVIVAEFRNIEFDTVVFEQVQSLKSLDTETIAEAMGSTRLQVAAAVARLGRRGFLSNFLNAVV